MKAHGPHLVEVRWAIKLDLTRIWKDGRIIEGYSPSKYPPLLAIQFLPSRLAETLPHWTAPPRPT